MATKQKFMFVFSEVTGTPTNFNNWASWISYCLASFGWTQTNDTGQVQWYGGTVTSATNVTGNTWRYAFSGGFTGSTTNNGTGGPIVGNAVTMTGFTSGGVGNNVTGVVTSVAGGANTFDIVNPTGTTSVSGTGVITLNATAPTASSNTYPPASGVFYEIWKTTDASSSTFPIYMKIWYGCVSGNIPGMWIQLGTGSDGAGNLTGNVSQAYYTANGSASNSAIPAPCYASGDGSRFSLAMFDTGNTVYTAWCCGVERSKDQAGNDTALYATIWSTGYNQIFRQQCIFPIGGAGTVTICETNSLAMCVPQTATSFSFAGTVGVAPLFPLIGCLGNPLLGLVGFMNNDFVDGLSFQTSMYGVSHTYLPISAYSGGASRPTPTTGARTAIRWE